VRLIDFERAAEPAAKQSPLLWSHQTHSSSFSLRSPS
jgi:hypothetical protein